MRTKRDWVYKTGFVFWVLAAAGCLAERPSHDALDQESAQTQLRTPTLEVECYLPVALADCNVPASPAVNPDPLYVRMYDQPQDDLVWAVPIRLHIATLNEQLRDVCAAGPVYVGARVHIASGVVGPLANRVADVINGVQPGASPWPLAEFPAGPPDPFGPDAFGPDSLIDPLRWGHVVAAPVPLIDVGGQPGDCSGLQYYDGHPRVTGLVRGFFYDARFDGAADRGFMFQLDYLHGPP